MSDLVAMMLPESHIDMVKCLVERRDGGLLSGSRNEIKHWRLNGNGAGRCIGTFTNVLIHGWVNAIVDWDDDLFVSACSSGSIVVWSLETGRPVGKPMEHPYEGVSALIKAVHIAKDPVLISGGEHGEVRSWDLKTRTQLMLFPAPSPRSLLSLCELDDGRLAVAGNYGVMVLDETRICWTKPFVDPRNNLAYDVACGVQPNTIAVATIDTVTHEPLLEIWNISDNEKTLTMQGHLRGASQLIRSNDNRAFITSSWDSTVKKWCPYSGRCLSSTTTPCGASCLLELNNRSLVVGLSDGRIAFLGLPP